jgi:tetratricopeptide (TPR) repeat protein
MVLRAIAFFAALVIATATCWADDRLDCIQDKDADLEIKGCSAVIASGRATRDILAIAHSNRGSAYHTKGDLDRAAADYTEAIGFNPKYTPAYAGRGYVYVLKDDCDRAIADFPQRRGNAG